MEGLEINAIPPKLLARILLQLPTLPPRKENIGLLSIMTAGLQQYGHTGDLNAFLEYCKTLVPDQDTVWPWEQYTITKEYDWNKANDKKTQQVVGLRFLIRSETERKRVALTRWSKNSFYDPKSITFYQGRAIPIDQLLTDTLNYLSQENQMNGLVESMIELRLEQYARDKFTFQQQSNQLDHADYYLMGVLMVRYDSTANKGYSSNAWSLYLRDYIEDPEGSIWRIFCDEQDQKVSSDQALADIRGMTTHHTEPTQFSKDYRPVYVFYANLDLLQNQQTQPEGHVITLEDYTFDEEDEDSRIQEEEEEEDVPCMHCGIKEIVNDINDMFFCELCNQGVHQLCEEPPIQAFEKNVDPWYCRTCCRAQGLPIPTEQEFSSAKRKRQDEPSSTEQEKVIKKTE